MKTTNQFYWKFIDTLVYNIATIAAVVVALSQFVIRAWNENNCSDKVRQFTIKSLHFVNTITSEIYNNLNHDLAPQPVTVPVAKVSTRSTKRRKA